MTELLEAYQKAIDTSDFDIKNERNEVRVLLADYTSKMKESDDTQGLKYLQLESDIHSITKSVVDGLSPVMQQTRQTEDGKTVEVIWPPFNFYGKLELDYFENRYNGTQNIFYKTEYGLFVFLKNRLQHDKERVALVKNLVDLANIYRQKLLLDESRQGIYSHALQNRLMDAMEILVRSSGIKGEFESFIKEIENWFLSWPVDHKAYVSFVYIVTQVFSENKKIVQPFIDVDKILLKLEQGIAHFSNASDNIAVSISEKTVLFCSALRPNEKRKYVLQLANFYETEGDKDAQKNHSVGASRHYENALVNYTNLKEQAAIERVSKKYEANKGKLEMGTIRVESDERASAVFNDFVDNAVGKKSPDLILSCLCGYHIMGSADSYKTQANKSANSNDITNMVTVQHVDKFGNTLRVYTNKAEREFYHISNVINLSHQTNSQIIFEILWRSLKAGFFSYQDVKVALEKTWLNQPVHWMRHGSNTDVIPLEVILPGIENFFNELDRRIKDENYLPNLVLCSDSLATKVEMILRYMCKNLGVPTFRFREQGGVILTDEKTLGMLLEDLEGLIEENDTILVKHLLNEKGGLNIRNHIAHGLLDAKEYTPGTPLTILGIILRLSQYAFTASEKEPE